MPFYHVIYIYVKKNLHYRQNRREERRDNTPNGTDRNGTATESGGGTGAGRAELRHRHEHRHRQAKRHRRGGGGRPGAPAPAPGPGRGHGEARAERHPRHGRRRGEDPRRVDTTCEPPHHHGVMVNQPFCFHVLFMYRSLTFDPVPGEVSPGSYT